MEDRINTIIHADCLEYLRDLPDKCISLVLIDPPYNISHAKWDKWKKQEDYINWLGSVFLECQRVLKDNGSFYFWHNDFKQMAELQHWISQNTRFVFNSIISWVKPNFRPISWKNKREGSDLRSWFSIQEYCLYYTFENRGTGLSDIHERRDCFVSIKEYMRQEKRKIKEKMNFETDAKFNDFVNKLTNTAGVVSRHYFSDNQWQFPAREKYTKLQTTGFFQKPYKDLRNEYEKLRTEYEELRPRFNIQNEHDYNNAWCSKIDKASKFHTCEKPQDLLKKIILTSSNENDIVLDCFAGSGSTLVAAQQCGRRYMGCEKDEVYYKIALDRLDNTNYLL